MDVFVARQAIFDRDSRVHAYELLYRSNTLCNSFTGNDEDSTTLDVIASSLLTIGLNSIAVGKKAFINFGRNLLVDGLVSIPAKGKRCHRGIGDNRTGFRDRELMPQT